MRKKQFSMYLSHGTTFKSVRSYYNIPDRINYCLVSGDGVRELMSYELNYDINRTVALGFPRNDILGHSKIDVKKLFEDKFEKIVVWYPTFRQHKNGLTTATENKGVPIIHDEERAAELNSYAKEKNMLIVIKPHFAQDVSYIKNLKLSNILLINDEFFIEKNISSYEFINGSDALITDYSSVYFDYTLCDKPVAAIWEDIEEYKKKPGLIENYEEFMSGAEKIYDLKEFISFLSRVSRGEDKLCEQRRAIRDLVNKSTDGKNACRVVDFILEKINYK